MKTLFTQLKLRTGIFAMFILMAGLFTAQKTQAACHASFKDTVMGATVKFTSTSTSSGGHISYTWSFGDGTYAYTGDPSHTYAYNSTSYTVCLHIYDSTNSCRDSVCSTINTGKSTNSCVANIVLSINGMTVSFSDSNSTAIAHKHSTTWDFGDGTKGSGDYPKHTYTKSGQYTVCDVEYDSSTSCSSNTCRVFSVSNCTLTASFTYTQNDRTVTLTNTSVTPPHTKIGWYWSGGSDSGATVTYTFDRATFPNNQYSIELALYDTTTNCLATVYQTITFCSAIPTFTQKITNLQVQFDAATNNAASVKYSWTFGDGSSSKDRNPLHTYTNGGTYTICLTATDTVKSCSTNYCSNIKLANTSNTYCISGSATTGSTQAGKSKVYLIVYNPADSSLKAIDSVELSDTTGFYSFCNLSNGTYYTKVALLKSNTNYASYIPTYHNNATLWSNAVAITVNNAAVLGANIAMKAGTNPGGPGFIGGKISAGANKTGDPEAGIAVILYDASNNPVQYTYSDANGAYSFSNLAYGTYEIYVDVLNIVCTPSTVTISGTTPNVTDGNMSINIKTANPTLSNSGIKAVTVAKDNATVYPNPVNDKLIIATNLQNTQNVSGQIFDVAGKVVMQFNRSIQSGNQTLELDASALHNGIYIVKMQMQQDNKLIETRFVKAQ